MTGPVSAELARTLLERLRRMQASPGVVLDALDHQALAWAVVLADTELGRIEAADRARRAEDDTSRVGPAR